MALIATLKDPKASYAIQIPALSLLLFLQRGLGSPHVAAVPVWWSTGSHQQMLLVLLACMCAALGRILYVETRIDSIMDEALRVQKTKVTDGVP